MLKLSPITDTILPTPSPPSEGIHSLTSPGLGAGGWERRGEERAWSSLPCGGLGSQETGVRGPGAIFWASVSSPVQ